MGRIARIGCALSVFAWSALAQTSIHITAIPQAPNVAAVSFGKLKNAAVYDIDLCQTSGAPAKIPTALVRQKVQLPRGYALLSNDSALMVIQAAQGNSTLGWLTRALNGTSAGVTQGDEVYSLVRGKQPSWAAAAALGVGLAAVLVNGVFPILRTNAITNSPKLLPESLDFTQGPCVAPAVALVSVPHRPVPGPLDVAVGLP